MPTDRINDLRAFHGFVEQRFGDEVPVPTLDEALALWDYENQTDEERKQTLDAIRRGLDDMHAGRTVDAFEFAENVRRKLASTAKR
jgi:hypothetical protein